jgi:hypothetical protein
MMSNRRRSAPVINAHFPKDQEGRSYCSSRRKSEKTVALIQQVMLRLISSSEEKRTYLRMNHTNRTPQEGNDLQLLHIVCKVTVK